MKIYLPHKAFLRLQFTIDKSGVKIKQILVKRRLPISTRLRTELLVECCHKCSIPNCTVQVGLQAHHINSKPDDNRKENLLMLCPTHHDMTTRKIITKMACQMYKENLQKLIPKSGEGIFEMINECTKNAVREEFEKAKSNWLQTSEGGIHG